jgi:hypothetical protein
MLGLRYVAGAIHGKSLKRKTTKSDDKREKTKKYEENRKAPKEGEALRCKIGPTFYQKIMLDIE